MSNQEIANEIKNYIANAGSSYNTWYVGIAQDARARLFNDHGVKEKEDLWIYRTASTSEDARIIEDYFINTLGTDGGPGGGDETTKRVYAYKKAPHTDP